MNLTSTARDAGKMCELGELGGRGHARNPTPGTRLTRRLENAFFTRGQEGINDLTGLVSHSDAGSQYSWVAFTKRLIEAGVDPSVGSVGDALDNALAETTVGSFKNELIWREGPWRDVDHVEIETLNWLDWFNTERPHEYLDDLTPARAEELHYIHITTAAVAG